MRVCTFYESRLGRNDGPPLYWTHAMKEMGIDVTHLSSQHLPKEDEFDAYLWVDWGEDGLGGILPYKPIDVSSLKNTIYIASDTHLGFEYRVEKAKEFKKVYVNQKEAVALFRKEGVEAEWLPHAVEPRAYPSTPLAIKKYDICFVGFVTFIKRAKFLDKVFKSYPNFYYGQLFFEDAAEIYRKSKIVLNTSATDDLNMRFFEGWATGSFTLSEMVPSMNDLDMPVKVNSTAYHNIETCKMIIDYYIKNPAERIEICNTMKEWILKNHTYRERVKKVFNIDDTVRSGYVKENCITAG